MYGSSFQSSMTLDATMPQERSSHTYSLTHYATHTHSLTLPQERMANHVRFTGKAGDVLLFDTACYHTAMPNRHGKVITFEHFSCVRARVRACVWCACVRCACACVRCACACVRE